jgi:hypothetical protein
MIVLGSLAMSSERNKKFRKKTMEKFSYRVRIPNSQIAIVH